MSSFPFIHQHDQTDCGPSCLHMVSKFYGKNYNLQYLRENCFITREGVSLLGISEAAEKIGFRTIGVNLKFESLANEAQLPCIVHWNQNHFIVVYKIKKKLVYVSDPAYGLLKFSISDFKRGWINNSNNDGDFGTCLLLEPTSEFYKTIANNKETSGFKFLYSYILVYQKFFFQLFVSLLFSSIVQLIFPFISQAIVDTGINTRDLNFIYLALMAQMTLFISRTTVDFIRSRILIHISARINISILSDFLSKLMRLPISFFDNKMTGDILQRLNDHERLEQFFSSQMLGVLFSSFNLIIFGVVLAIYEIKIFIVFMLGSTLYCLWMFLFMKKRKDLDYRRFAQLSANQNNTLELIEGMQEIKLNNCERQKRWKWEGIQANLFYINLNNLSVTQYQISGSVFINETKNIIITIMAATAVLNGQMTLGMMLAIQYIIGQLNSPIEQMIEFIQSSQLAKISIERLCEIHIKKDEEIPEETKLTYLPENRSIILKNVTYQYEGPHSPKVLNNVNITIPQKKTTAIVGASGSGKTTLLKLLLGFYLPVEGSVNIGDINLLNYNNSWWRSQCGVVMQDGFIFSETIASNIAISDEKINKEKLLYAVKMANIQDFIESLPLSYNTIIGKEGNGLSQGQKQRILIARAIYKNPEFVFFDEATNALDANNERIIMENLLQFFKGKTVVVVAHRLSTVKNADQIIVLNNGCVTEIGTHHELTSIKGSYFNLVKNQLELGN
ncbi:MAG: peptidase domain-containing ABC transporter [Bacteroidota bacterium]|nr:peptidase domain-containing ABC transporter [Bacteroidota bacterium]